MTTLVKKTIRNESGFTAILMAIMSLIGVTILSFLLDVQTQTYTLQEVQGMMDNASTNTLRQVIDTDLLKEDWFGFESSNGSGTIGGSSNSKEYAVPTHASNQMMSLYQQQLNDLVTNNINVLDIQIQRQNTRFKLAKGTWGFGSSSKARPYLILDSVVKIKMSHTTTFDYTDTFQNMTFEMVDGNSFEVINTYMPSNNEVILTVKTVARAVFR